MPRRERHNPPGHDLNEIDSVLESLDPNSVRRYLPRFNTTYQLPDLNSVRNLADPINFTITNSGLGTTPEYFTDYVLQTTQTTEGTPMPTDSRVRDSGGRFARIEDAPTQEAPPMPVAAERLTAFNNRSIPVEEAPALRVEARTPWPVQSVRYGSVTYGAKLREAFTFFRRHGSGKYSDRTLMRLIRWADMYNLTNPVADWTTQYPVILRVEQPRGFDEDTEVKTGGIIGMIVAWPGEAGEVRKTILAVHRSFRRQKVGTDLLDSLVNVAFDQQFVFWIGRGNVEGQAFLLNHGFDPVGYTTNGSIGFSTSQLGDNDA